MDNLEQYREIIKMIIGDYHRLNLKSPEPSIESFCVFDEVRDHYLLIVMGWEGSERLKSVMIPDFSPERFKGSCSGSNGMMVI